MAEVLIDIGKISVRTLEKIAKDYNFHSEEETIGTMGYYNDFISYLEGYTVNKVEEIVKKVGV